MPKHPVPKKKHSKTRSKKRYSTYQGRARLRLLNLAKSAIHRLKKAEKIEEAKAEKAAAKVTTIKAD